MMMKVMMPMICFQNGTKTKRKCTNLKKKKKVHKIKRNNVDYNNRFIPPLYFQHQGHSRTIIGIIHNRKSGLRHLLVLDPSVKNGGISLLNKIKWKHFIIVEIKETNQGCQISNYCHSNLRYYDN